MAKKIGPLGIGLTAIYLAGWATLVYFRADTFRDMKLNEIGDFLGGSFGPLAFLWLVLGFFQQGIELRQNSEALRLQAEELRNSVEQQKAMVAVAKDEYALGRRSREEAEYAARPLFHFDSSAGGFDGEKWTWDVAVSNAGGTCTRVVFRFPPESRADDITVEPSHLPSLIRGDVPTKIRFTGEPEPNQATYLSISYIDSFGRPFVGRWQVWAGGDGRLQFVSDNKR